MGFDMNKKANVEPEQNGAWTRLGSLATQGHNAPPDFASSATALNGYKLPGPGVPGQQSVAFYATLPRRAP